MRKFLKVIIILFLICAIGYFIIVPKTFFISMKIKEGTLSRTGLTVVIADYNIRTYGYGKNFKLEKKENGKWKELEFVKTDEKVRFLWDSSSMIVKTGKSYTMVHNWESLYGSLENGKYRLVKNLDEKGIGKYITVEFNIDDETLENVENYNRSLDNVKNLN